MASKLGKSMVIPKGNAMEPLDPRQINEHISGTLGVRSRGMVSRGPVAVENDVGVPSIASVASAQMVGDASVTLGGPSFMGGASFVGGFDVAADGGRNRTTGDIEVGLVKMRVDPNGALSVGIAGEKGSIQGVEAVLAPSNANRLLGKSMVIPKGSAMEPLDPRQIDEHISGTFGIRSGGTMSRGPVGVENDIGASSKTNGASAQMVDDASVTLAGASFTGGFDVASDGGRSCTTDSAEAGLWVVGRCQPTIRRRPQGRKRCGRHPRRWRWYPHARGIALLKQGCSGLWTGGSGSSDVGGHDGGDARDAGLGSTRMQGARRGDALGMLGGAETKESKCSSELCGIHSELFFIVFMT
ncbi:unnamed protein product [Ilex paraguariensis]|uniref:Uncharacterized protein n=1 Tax=Ilex paraguariensis TaxID=185542 RepID=A0ABC8TXE0_9AQUA